MRGEYETCEVWRGAYSCEVCVGSEVTGTYSCVESGACEGTGAYQACEGCEVRGVYETCEVTGAYKACEASGVRGESEVTGAYKACEMRGECEASEVRVAVLFAILSVELVEFVFFFEEWAVWAVCDVWVVCEGMGAYVVRLVSHVRWACDNRSPCVELEEFRYQVQTIVFY